MRAGSAGVTKSSVAVATPSNIHTAIKPLYPSAIYVNASTDHWLAASCGDRSSKPIREGKRWVTGYQWHKDTKPQGQALPLIFAHYVLSRVGTGVI
jgi:hypothetical protein